MADKKKGDGARFYTSGSTGKPKGVVYSHRNLVHGSYFYARLCNMGPGSRALYKSPTFWAVVEYELFPVLLSGGHGGQGVGTAVMRGTPGFDACVVGNVCAKRG